MAKDRITVGLVEDICLDGHDSQIKARIDTGATNSSIDIALASKLKLGPIIESRLVKNVHGSKLRPIIEAEITIRGRRIKSRFTLADRSHMKYKVLIGQNILKSDFLIDPQLE